MTPKRTNAELFIDSFKGAADTRKFSVLIELILGGASFEGQHFEVVRVMRETAKRLGFGEKTDTKQLGYEAHWKQRLVAAEQTILVQVLS